MLENEEIQESTEEIHKDEKKEKFYDKCLTLMETITKKVRNFVLTFGELILTISIIVGFISAILGGLSDMGNIGFFTGLSNMLQNMIGVVMSGIVIFLLFAIKENTDK